MAAEPGLAEEPTSPLAFGATYVSDSFGNVRGGRRRGFAQMGLLEARIEWAADAIGVPGAKALLTVQHVHGKSLSGELVGDGQVVSNIDAVDGLRPMEAWLSLPVLHRGFVKAGLIDLNGEFDVQTFGSLFVNSSHGIGPDFSQSGLNGPSIFPTSSTAFVAGWNAAGWSARLGLFDGTAGDPDRSGRTVIRFPGSTGLLIVGEGDFAVGGSAEIQLGAWIYTSRFDALVPQAEEGAPRRGNKGAYALAEGRIATLGSDDLGAWVRLGVAESTINPVGVYVGAGLTHGDDAGRWGLAVGHARLGDPAYRSRGGAGARAETNIEITYRREISDRLVLQPDLQYVINSGWDPRFRNALVVGLRAELKLF